VRDDYPSLSDKAVKVLFTFSCDNILVRKWIFCCYYYENKISITVDNRKRNCKMPFHQRDRDLVNHAIERKLIVTENQECATCGCMKLSYTLNMLHLITSTAGCPSNRGNYVLVSKTAVVFCTQQHKVHISFATPRKNKQNASKTLKL
jgi:hypothetical protein